MNGAPGVIYTRHIKLFQCALHHASNEAKGPFKHPCWPTQKRIYSNLFAYILVPNRFLFLFAAVSCYEYYSYLQIL